MTAEIVSVIDWASFMAEVGNDLKTARESTSRPSIFTNEILYNIPGLAIEKQIMGASLRTLRGFVLKHSERK